MYIGMGAFHTGVQLYSNEYSFGGSQDAHPSASGMHTCTPKQAEGIYRTSIDMGMTSKTSKEVDRILSELGEKYKAAEYNLFTRNCNDFCDELCFALVGKQIPPWINRMSSIARYCPCVFPKTTDKAPLASFNAFQGQGYALSDAKPIEPEQRKNERQAALERLAKAAKS